MKVGTMRLLIANLNDNDDIVMFQGSEGDDPEAPTLTQFADDAKIVTIGQEKVAVEKNYDGDVALLHDDYEGMPIAEVFTNIRKAVMLETVYTGPQYNTLGYIIPRK
jgi:hypothetical protein